LDELLGGFLLYAGMVLFLKGLLLVGVCFFGVLEDVDEMFALLIISGISRWDESKNLQY
jgi:hypothetical protein